MKRGSTLFLRGIILLLGVVVLVSLIRFPMTEGRAVNLDLVQIYADPLIIYTYIGSIAFFVGLYQAFKLLQLIDMNKAFTSEAVGRLRNIKWVSVVLIGFIQSELLYIRFFAHGDDPTGPIMLGMMVSLAIGAIATAAGIFQKLCQNAVDLKFEHDLTI